jgi:site-specific recombinase XerC
MKKLLTLCKELIAAGQILGERAVHTLNYELKQLCNRNKDGSYQKREARERILALVGNQLHEMGFRNVPATGLKPKHVDALVDRWQTQGLAIGTIKNRLAEIRWWAEKIGKQNVVARSNDHYAIPHRQYATNEDKSRQLSTEELKKIDDPFTKASLKLQAEFGLRREESLKIQPIWAHQGDMLVLKPSWTKGGRPREIPIRTESQRLALEEAKRLAATTSQKSLIEKANYKEQLERFKYWCGKAGIDGVHGHRHHYAQQRYVELTGWECPAKGGPTSKQLTEGQKVSDQEARLTISSELGHSREQITVVYLGR